MNTVLQSILLFPLSATAIPSFFLDTQTYVGLNLLAGVPISGGSSSALVQEGFSISRLYDIETIFIKVTELPINGDNEGTNSQFSSLTDFMPNLDQQTLGSTFSYVPYFYRLYTVTQNTPVQRLNIEFWVLTKKGFRYMVQIMPGDSFSAKLVFINQ
jgi:hypothetical protein